MRGKHSIDELAGVISGVLGHVTVDRQNGELELKCLKSAETMTFSCGASGFFRVTYLGYAPIADFSRVFPESGGNCPAILEAYVAEIEGSEGAAIVVAKQVPESCILIFGQYFFNRFAGQMQRVA